MDKIVITFIVAVLLTIFDYAHSIQCYGCTVAPIPRMPNQTQQLCTKFTESDDFVFDCPYSTMCMKRIFKYQLLDGKIIETISRGCAQQKRTEQVYVEGAWKKENTVEEPYEEGCFVQKDIGNIGPGVSSTTYCHCRGAYCNTAARIAKESPSYHTDAMAVIFVFNVMKYLRNMDYH